MKIISDFKYYCRRHLCLCASVMAMFCFVGRSFAICFNLVSSRYISHIMRRDVVFFKIIFNEKLKVNCYDFILNIVHIYL